MNPTLIYPLLAYLSGILVVVIVLRVVRTRRSKLSGHVLVPPPAADVANSTGVNPAGEGRAQHAPELMLHNSTLRWL